MARLRAFGTKARGSVGAVTYYVANGQQIAREKATEVKNPKSSAQSAQRMKMAPAQKFFEAFSGIVNHSWQGVKYGTASRQKFMSEAMKQNGGPYVVKGTTTFVPGTYLIADGSLPEIKGKFYNDNEGFTTNLFMDGYNTRADFVNKIINNNPNFEIGDKLTFIAIIGIRTAPEPESPLTSTFYPVIRQVILRQQLEDGETDDFESLSGSGILSDNDGYFFFDLTITPYNPGNNSNTIAFAVIHSRGQNENNDQRSKTRFAITDNVYNTFYTESAYKLALASYQNTSNAPLGAEWYLNNFPAGTIGRVVLKSVTAAGNTANCLALVITEAGANQTFILVNGLYHPIDANGNVIEDITIESTTPKLPWNRNYLKLFSGN